MPLEPSTTAALIGGSAQLLGSGLSGHTKLKTFKRSLAWNKELAKNQIQFKVNDLKAAGLNPILAASGGISGSAPGAPATPDIPNYGDAATTALNYKLMNA